MNVVFPACKLKFLHAPVLHRSLRKNCLVLFVAVVSETLWQNSYLCLHTCQVTKLSVRVLNLMVLYICVTETDLPDTHLSLAKSFSYSSFSTFSPNEACT